MNDKFNEYILKAGEEKDLRMYILVNQDIKINKGKLAGQVGHAVSSMLYSELPPTKVGGF